MVEDIREKHFDKNGDLIKWTTSDINTPHKLGPISKGNGMVGQQRWKNLPSQLEKARAG